MSATLDQLNTQVRENLGQPSAPTSGKWSDSDINQKMVNRIRRLNRKFMVRTINTSTTVDKTSFAYDFPADIVDIIRIELWDSSLNTNLGELVNWKIWADSGTKKILFQEVFNSSTNILKIFGLKRLAESGTMDVPLEVEELIVLGATIDCIRDLYRRRIDMSRFLADVQRQSGSTIDIRRALSDYKEEYNEIYRSLKTSKVSKLSYQM